MIGTPFILPKFGLLGLLVRRQFCFKEISKTTFEFKASFAGLIYINSSQIYTFTIGSLGNSIVAQRFRFFVDNVLLIDQWSIPAATTATLTGTMTLEVPAGSTSFYYSIKLEYSKSSTGCHAFSLNWNLAPPNGPSVPSEFYALQVNCKRSLMSIFRPGTFPTCMSMSTRSVPSSPLSPNSEILLSITPKDDLGIHRFFDDWTQFDFFLAIAKVFNKNPRQLLLSSKTGSSASLSTVVTQAGQYQVVLGTQSQQFSVATLFSDLQCSKNVAEMSFPSPSIDSSTWRNVFSQYRYSCVIWKVSFRSKYDGVHVVILENLSRWSAVQLSANDHMIAWNGSLVFSVELNLKSHDIVSLITTQLSDRVDGLSLQVLESRYFTDSPWSAKAQPAFTSSSGSLNDAFATNYSVLVVSGVACHSRTKLQGQGLSVATEGSPTAFSIAMKDAFDNSVNFSVAGLLYSARDTGHLFKASSQYFAVNSCIDSSLGCGMYTPIGSGSFRVMLTTGAQEIGLVATYFSDVGQSTAVASTFGLTEIVANGNPFDLNSEFAIRWSGFIQKPSPLTMTFTSTVLSENESVFVWIDNILVLSRQSGDSLSQTSPVTFEDTLTRYEIEILYTKRSTSATCGFSLTALGMTFSNYFNNMPSSNVAVFAVRSQLLAFSPSIARASTSTVVTLIGLQLSAACSYVCTWTDDSSQRGTLKSDWQILVSPSILLCGTPSATALQGQTTLQVIESCGLNVRALEPSEGLQFSNNFLFQSKIVHSSLQRISRSQRLEISTSLLLSGTESILGASAACMVYGRSSSSDVEDYSGPFAVTSGIASQKSDNLIACPVIGLGEWNGVGQVSVSVEDSMMGVMGSATVLLSGLVSNITYVYVTNKTTRCSQPSSSKHFNSIYIRRNARPMT